MADVWVQVMTRSDADRDTFDRDARRKMASEDAIGSELLASRYPTQTSVRNDAALIYLSLGRPADALRHFSAVTRLEPASAVAWYNEGTVLELLRRPQDAADRYRRAIQLNPRYSAAHNNLGNLLIAEGQADLAIEEYRRAVEADPDNAEAQNNLGGLLVTGNPADAEPHLRAALRVRPDFAEAHFNLGRVLTVKGAGAAAVAEYRDALNARGDWRPALYNLAWLLAAHPDPAVRDPAEAARLAQRVTASGDTPDAAALDLLAAAQASGEHFDDAIKTATEALDLAQAAGQSPLASQIRERLALYRQHRPFVID